MALLIMFENQKSSKQIKIRCIILLILAYTASSCQETKCPFHHLFHFGDGFTDLGNSIHVKPGGHSLPAARLPYGKTFPGAPTGRWSDGRVIFDYAAHDFGFQDVIPYLSMETPVKHDGVIFSVARSIVLGRGFFKSRGIDIPPYAVSLQEQLRWFKTYFKSLCSNPKDCTKILQDSVVFFGDIESNDLGYSLLNDKSVEEVKAYVSFIVKKSIKAAREIMRMGAKRVLIPQSAPLGCYPYILTTLSSNTDPADYDDLGCLRSVNNLILFKNNKLEQAVDKLRLEFPNTHVLFGKIYEIFPIIINQTRLSGFNPLEACCGVGGNYNYDHKRFCGSPGVSVCNNPDKYIFWDSIHLTQEAVARIERIGIASALAQFNCTS